MPPQEIPMTDGDVMVIEAKLKKFTTTIFMVNLWVTIVMVVFGIIPTKYIPTRRGRGGSGTDESIMDLLGVEYWILITVGLLLLLNLAMVFDKRRRRLKKDMEDRRKKVCHGKIMDFVKIPNDRKHHLIRLQTEDGEELAIRASNDSIYGFSPLETVDIDVAVHANEAIRLSKA